VTHERKIGIGGFVLWVEDLRQSGRYGRRMGPDVPVGERSLARPHLEFLAHRQVLDRPQVDAAPEPPERFAQDLEVRNDVLVVAGESLTRASQPRLVPGPSTCHPNDLVIPISARLWSRSQPLRRHVFIGSTMSIPARSASSEHGAGRRIERATGG
jgi:hypothetical protein